MTERVKFKQIPKPLPLIEQGWALTRAGVKVRALRLSFGSRSGWDKLVLTEADAVKMAGEVLRIVNQLDIQQELYDTRPSHGGGMEDDEG